MSAWTSAAIEVVMQSAAHTGCVQDRYDIGETQQSAGRSSQHANSNFDRTSIMDMYSSHIIRMCTLFKLSVRGLICSSCNYEEMMKDLLLQH